MEACERNRTAAAYRDGTIHDQFARAAARWPRLSALVVPSRFGEPASSVSYKELSERVLRLAGALHHVAPRVAAPAAPGHGRLR